MLFFTVTASFSQWFFARVKKKRLNSTIIWMTPCYTVLVLAKKIRNLVWIFWQLSFERKIDLKELWYMFPSFLPCNRSTFNPTEVQRDRLSSAVNYFSEFFLIIYLKVYNPGVIMNSVCWNELLLCQERNLLNGDALIKKISLTLVSTFLDASIASR